MAVYHEMQQERRHRVMVELGTVAFYSGFLLALGAALVTYDGEQPVPRAPLTLLVLLLGMLTGARLCITANRFDYATDIRKRAERALGLTGFLRGGSDSCKWVGRCSAIGYVFLLTVAFWLLVWYLASKHPETTPRVENRSVLSVILQPAQPIGDHADQSRFSSRR